MVKVKVAVRKWFGSSEFVPSRFWDRFEELSGDEFDSNRHGRMNRHVIQVLEEMTAANWGHEFEIVELEEGTRFIIKDYDGKETLITEDRVRWKTARVTG